MYKGLVAEIAKEVGRSAALLLNQIYQWFKTKNVDKVFRTNEELKSDLDDIISTATIQRAKKKLIEKGYLIVSFDKGYKRTTHFKLTEKAHGLLSGKQEGVKDKVEPSINKPSSKSYSKPFQVKKVEHDNRPKQMKESFEEAGKVNPNATVGIPEELKKLFKSKVKPVEKLKDLPLIVADENDFGNIEYEVKEGDIYADEEYFGNTDEDWAMIDVCTQQQIDCDNHSFSMNDIMNIAFNKVPNVEVRENNRMIIENQSFKEEY